MQDQFDDDTAMKDRVLAALIDSMEEVLGSSKLSPPAGKGLAVEVAAPDKEHLQDGLEKAGDVIDQAPDASADPLAAKPAASGGESDEDRLLALLEGEEDEDGKDKR